MYRLPLKVANNQEKIAYCIRFTIAVQVGLQALDSHPS
jgi:hypothetical protein